MFFCGITDLNLEDKTIVKDNQTFWLAVKVERGFPAMVKCFWTGKSALKQEATWRKDMNIDYDEADVFEVFLKDIK